MRTATYWAGVKLALDTIRHYKLRAFLTVLGVIIGTGTIIGVGAILAGMDGAITNILRSFGTNTLIVFKFKIGFRVGHLSADERTRKPIALEHARAVSERCPSIEYASAYLFPPRGIHRIKYKANDNYNLEMGGTEEGYAQAGQADMKYGRFFTDIENRRRLPVVVLGEDVYKSLFSNLDALGKVVEVDGHHFEVVGVMNRPAFLGPGMTDNRVLFPYWTMRKAFPGAQEHMLVIAVKEGRNMAAAADEVRTALRLARRVPHDKPDDFFISTAEQMVEDFRRITSVTTLVMVVLSSVGLLVGGIGVMNIMLVSVTERTKEIGVRKAIGARRRDIIVQFLTEAVTLTGLGGLLGMLLGWSISTVCRIVFPSLPTSVPPWAAVLGVAVSVGVGVFFGIWPANKAARLDPVAALRYE